MDAFSNDLIDLQIRLRRSVGKSDLTYIRNCELAGRACTAVGFATAWLYLNPLSIVLVAIGQVARWGIAHHILHHAFEGIEGCPPRFRATSFGKGWRRLLDWNEWMLPAAFQHEHNVHHVYTGEHQDPDVVEANLEFLRTSPQPKWVKYVMTAAIALTWRLSYYAPGTFIQLRRRQHGQKPTPYELHSLLMFAHLFSPFSKEGLRFWGLCILPTLITRFVMLPAAFLVISSHAAVNVLITVMAAELLTNVYTFVLIASSHTGDDIYRFSEHSAGRGGFHRHQVLGTINYSRGPVLRDFLHMWINYQIEHHLFPNLPPSQYPKCAAEVQAICEKHGVPYRAEPLHRRMWRMLDIAVGNTSMRTDNDARSDAPPQGHAAVEPKPSFSEAFEAATPSPA